MTTSSNMSTKVLPSQKVSIPAGRDIGGFPQTSPKNPSQTNGNNPPKVPSERRDLGEAAPFRPDPNGVDR
jgi:hypothetical protein